MYLFWERKQWWWCGCHRRWGPEHTRMVSWRWVGSIWFSLVLSALGLVYGPSPQQGCPGFVPRVWVSQSEKGSCSVSCFFHTAPTAATTAQHRGAWGHWAGSAVPPSPAAACVWGQNTAPSSAAPAASLCSRLRHHCRLWFFTQHVSQPTGGIRNSKFSKQFQYFQYICWGFTTVRGQKRFSTSHTQTLVHFLFLASLYSVGPTQTATLRCSVQPCHGRTPHPFQYRGWSEVAERSNW